MALFHHSNQNYLDAASEAAKHARAKFEALIENGQQQGSQVINQVMSVQPDDYLVRPAHMEFRPADNGVVVDMRTNGDTQQFNIHSHALGQIMEKSASKNPNKGYVDFLMAQGVWGPELLADILNKTYKNFNPDRKFLTRVVDGEIRGFLSDRYRRMDSRPILDAFVGACQKIGAVPCQGHALSTKVALKAMLPTIYEPVENEVTCFGAEFSNSDFGAGRLSISVFALRLWCTNFATTCDSFKKVHLGRRLQEGVSFSQETYDLDTKTLASAVTDMVAGELTEDKIDQNIRLLKAASLEKVDIRKSLKELQKVSKITKGELEKAEEALIERDPEKLPPGNTVYTLSNCLSWLGNQAEKGERQLELQKMAGHVLEKVKAA